MKWSLHDIICEVKSTSDLLFFKYLQISTLYSVHTYWIIVCTIWSTHNSTGLFVLPCTVSTRPLWEVPLFLAQPYIERETVWVLDLKVKRENLFRNLENSTHFANMGYFKHELNDFSGINKPETFKKEEIFT